jgi:glycosyltransferase involved in cell wall biosynthesis
MQRHIVVVDGFWLGHHPIYVKAFVRILLEAGYQVSVLCPAPDEVSTWVNQFPAIDKELFRAHYFIDRLPKLWKYAPRKIQNALSPLVRWYHVSQSLKAFYSSTEKPDLVFFAWLDSYLYGYLPVRVIDRLFPFLWSGLYFLPGYFRDLTADGEPRKGWFRPPVDFIAQSKWAVSIAILDAGIVSRLRAKLNGKQTVVFPDFTDELPPAAHYHLAEEIISKAKGRVIIGLLGSLERRKGLLTLLKIAQHPSSRDWFFVFAGELAEQTFSVQELKEIKSFFDVPRNNCFAYFNRIPGDDQFNALVNVCDVLYAVYQGFLHSSNVVSKAATYGKSLIVSSGGYMEEVVRQFELGEVIPAGDVESALSAMSRLTAGEISHRRLARMRDYSLLQSQDNLRHALLGMVANCIGHKTCTDVPNSYSCTNRQ